MNTLNGFDHCTVDNFNIGNLPENHIAEYELSSFIGVLHGACDQVKSAEAIVTFLKESNTQNFPRNFITAMTANSFILTNLMNISNILGKKNHNLEPALKFLS